MITAVRRTRKAARECGQSVIEFLLMMPLMLGLIVILIRVNSAIQVSIVNQQYARAQAHFLAYNSATYPHLNNRVNNLDSHEYNQLVLGVSETLVPSEDSGQYQPTATTQMVSTAPGADDTPKQSSERRSSVRNWNTVALCTQVNVARNSAGQYKPILSLSSDSAHGPTGDYNLNENTFFEYCHSPKGVYSNE